MIGINLLMMESMTISNVDMDVSMNVDMATRLTRMTPRVNIILDLGDNLIDIKRTSDSTIDLQIVFNIHF